MDFFLDADFTEPYTTLALAFDVIGWHHFTDDGPPIPADLEARRNDRARDDLAFQIAGGPSDVIVLASEVAVSRTGIAFSTANLSTQPFIHGLPYRLLVYENGWKDAPALIDEWAWFMIGFIIQGGQVREDRFDFEGLYGALANGRYMLMRQHQEDHMRPGAPRVQELLMVEFVIDDNTPMHLDDTPPAAADISTHTDEITPTGLRLTVTNRTPHVFSYNGPFIVQKYVYGYWENIYELAAPTRYQLSVGANDTAVISENWGERFGKLPPGRYQLVSHFSAQGTGQIVTHEFDISQEAFDAYAGDTPLNPMYEQNIIVTDVAVTPTGITIRWENISDRVFYTPWPGYWVESYSPEEGRGVDRLREAFDSVFSGPDADLRRVTIEMDGSGSWTYDTTAVHPGQHVYQVIDWGHDLPAGQYVISLEHFSPDEPGFVHRVRPWERFALRFWVE